MVENSINEREQEFRETELLVVHARKNKVPERNHGDSTKNRHGVWRFCQMPVLWCACFLWKWWGCFCFQFTVEAAVSAPVCTKNTSIFSRTPIGKTLLWIFGKQIWPNARLWGRKRNGLATQWVDCSTKSCGTICMTLIPVRSITYPVEKIGADCLTCTKGTAPWLLITYPMRWYLLLFFTVNFR